MTASLSLVGTSITVQNPAGKWNRLRTISSLGSSKKCLNKPCCVGVTHDNCIIVVDSGKQCYRLLKIKMDGNLIAYDHRYYGLYYFMQLHYSFS